MLSREGKTPAKLRDLKLTMPTARKITKTDLAKYAHAWNRKPHLVSLGSQKNYKIFNDEIIDEGTIPDVQQFKMFIAQAIIYRRAEKLIRPTFQGFHANITAYTVAIIADRMGQNISLNTIWQEQKISDAFVSLILQWSKEVNHVLRLSAGEKIVSEWAKKDDCWKIVREHSYSSPLSHEQL